MMWASFRMFIHLVYIFPLVKCSMAHLLIELFIFLLLSFKSSLYILDNTPLSDVPFANIFSQGVACLLILLTLSFKVEVLDFKWVQVIISFMDYSFTVLSKESLPYPRSSKFSPMLPSGSFIVFYFTFRSVMHFVFFFFFFFFFIFFFFFNAILVYLHSFFMYVCMYVCMYGFVGSSFLCEGFL